MYLLELFLFHDDVPFEFVDQVFAVMALCPQHSFQILTKRPARMLEYMNGLTAGAMREAAKQLSGYPGADPWDLDDAIRFRAIPLPNVWLGVSAENQETFDDRVGLLGQVPAAVRFISIEPQMEAIDVGNAFDAPPEGSQYGPIHWVIVGGESGPGARPFDVAWGRDVVRQCQAAEVPVFFKQMGSRPQTRNDKVADVWFYADGSDMETEPLDADSYRYQGAPVRLMLKDRKGGNPAEWPKRFRVREFPK